MGKLALLPVLVVLAASGCQAWPGGFAPAGSSEDVPAAAIYATVIRQLVTQDHTFGQGPSPFKRVFVVDGAIRKADAPLTGRGRPPEPFSPAVKRQILAALQDLAPVRFVSNPNTVIVGERGCARVRGGGALINLGPIGQARGKAVEVSNGLFIACLGGQWLTYVLEPRAGSWRVVGTTGPIVIS